MVAADAATGGAGSALEKAILKLQQEDLRTDKHYHRKSGQQKSSKGKSKTRSKRWGRDGDSDGGGEGSKTKSDGATTVGTTTGAKEATQRKSNDHPKQQQQVVVATADATASRGVAEPELAVEAGKVKGSGASVEQQKKTKKKGKRA